MRCKTGLAAMAAALALGSAGPALAWGDNGHMIVAAIAWDRMQPTTRAAITALLQNDPNLAPYAPGITHNAKGRFVSQGVWADRLRDSDRPGHGVSPTYAQNPKYLGTNKWHFVDTLFTGASTGDGANYDKACFQHPALVGAGPGFHVSTAQANAKACAPDKIEQFRAALADTSQPIGERRQALKFLIHLVGDLHQPLHAADHKDRGGNCVAVVGGNLHSHWDTKLVNKVKDQQTLVATATGLEADIPADTAAWTAGASRDWALESFTAAATKAYAFGPATLPACQPPVNQQIPFPQDYEADALDAVRDQLRKGGVRLAAVLDQALQ